jgi:hypothetical protein
MLSKHFMFWVCKCTKNLFNFWSFPAGYHSADVRGGRREREDGRGERERGGDRGRWKRGEGEGRGEGRREREDGRRERERGRDRGEGGRGERGEGEESTRPIS